MLLLAVLLPAVALLLPDLLTAALLPLLFCCRIGLVPGFVELVPHKLQLPSTEQRLERPIKYKTPGLQSSDWPPLTQTVKARVAEHGKSSNSKGCRHVVGYKSLSTY